MELSLIFPHQLFWPHPALQKGRPVLLIEDPLFFGTDTRWPMKIHRQKLLLHRSSLTEFAEKLRENEYEVRHLHCPVQPSSTLQILEKEVSPSVTVLHGVDPVDDVLHRRLHRFSQNRGLRLVLAASPNFLSPRDFLEEQLQNKRKPFMARFYETQRKRMGILLEKDGAALGGRWSFDTENRQKLPRKIIVPEPHFPRRRSSVNEAMPQIEKDFPHASGELGNFVFPVTHRDADAWLEDFLAWRFSDFGPYEDSISSQHSILFHSVLTPCLNIGLLDPWKVIERTLDHAATHDIPLNSLEGFIRQIIGWREFIRAMYEFKGVEMRTRNFWNFDRPMPSAFYSGTTGIEPVDHVIRQLLQTGYCHHIERLMILGNFMLLCRIHPDEVYRWFMEMFVDSYDWVMVPNVYGMSQFADGGSFTTKPYLSGSNYIRKMSDFSEGPWCEIWDALYWTFISDHQEFFDRNPRLSLMSSSWTKMNETKKSSLVKTASAFLKKLDKGGPV